MRIAQPHPIFYELTTVNMRGTYRQFRGIIFQYCGYDNTREFIAWIAAHRPCTCDRRICDYCSWNAWHEYDLFISFAYMGAVECGLELHRSVPRTEWVDRVTTSGVIVQWAGRTNTAMISTVDVLGELRLAPRPNCESRGYVNAVVTDFIVALLPCLGARICGPYQCDPIGIAIKRLACARYMSTGEVGPTHRDKQRTLGSFMHVFHSEERHSSSLDNGEYTMFALLMPTVKHTAVAVRDALRLSRRGGSAMFTELYERVFRKWPEWPDIMPTVIVERLRTQRGLPFARHCYLLDKQDVVGADDITDAELVEFCKINARKPLPRPFAQICAEFGDSSFYAAALRFTCDGTLIPTILTVLHDDPEAVDLVKNHLHYSLDPMYSLAAHYVLFDVGRADADQVARQKHYDISKILANITHSRNFTAARIQESLVRGMIKCHHAAERDLSVLMRPLVRNLYVTHEAYMMVSGMRSLPGIMHQQIADHSVDWWHRMYLRAAALDHFTVGPGMFRHQFISLCDVLDEIIGATFAEDSVGNFAKFARAVVKFTDTTSALIYVIVDSIERAGGDGGGDALRQKIFDAFNCRNPASHASKLLRHATRVFATSRKYATHLAVYMPLVKAKGSGAEYAATKQPCTFDY